MASPQRSSWLLDLVRRWTRRPTHSLRWLQWLVLVALLVVLARDFGGRVEVGRPLIPAGVLVFILAGLQAFHGGLRSIQPRLTLAHLLPLPFLIAAGVQAQLAGTTPWLAELHFSVWVLAYTVYWVALNWVRDARDARAIWVALVTVVVGLGATATYQYFFDAAAFSEREFVAADGGLASGSLADPEALGFLVGLVFPFLLVGAWMRRFLAPLRIVCALLAVSAVPVVWASGSSVGLVMLSLVVLSAPFFATRTRLRAVFSIVLLVLGGALALAGLQLLGGPAAERFADQFNQFGPALHPWGPLSDPIQVLLWLPGIVLMVFAWRHWGSLPYSKPHPDRDRRKRRARSERQPSPLHKVILGALLPTLGVSFAAAWFYPFLLLPFAAFTVFLVFALVAGLTPQKGWQIPRGALCGIWFCVPVLLSGWQLQALPTAAQAQYHAFVAERDLLALADDLDRIFSEPDVSLKARWHAAQARQLNPNRADTARLEADWIWRFRHAGLVPPSELALQAQELVEKALKKNSQDGRAHWLAAAVLAYQEAPFESIVPHLEAARALAPTEANAYALQGWLLFRETGDVETAREWIDAALVRDPQHREAQLYQSLLLLEE